MDKSFWEETGCIWGPKWKAHRPHRLLTKKMVPTAGRCHVGNMEDKNPQNPGNG